MKIIRILRLVVESRILIFLIALAMAPLKNFAEVNVQTGEKLFKQYCTSCHRIDLKVIGPPLKDITKRRPEDWLLKWIRNNSALRQSGDKDALALYDGYKTEMPTFTNLSDDDIRSILAYIETAPVPSAVPAEQQPGVTTQKPSVWIYVIISLLILIVFILLRTNGILLRSLREKSGENLPPKESLKKKLLSKKAISFYFLVLTFVAGYSITESAILLGHSKNYQPAQPIAFSHKMHAGIAQINCLYCHSGAEESKTAGIPSVSTCMNCHKAIKEGETPEQTAEIQKIYNHYENNEPIQWIKIHNLPDYVYFNHSQHVSVGLIDCKTCHGDVDQMDQVYQYSSLSMGWCVNCHRRTDVQFSGNHYYSMFTDLQKEVRDSTGAIKDTGNLHITEDMLGGTECQRCHY